MEMEFMDEISHLPLIDKETALKLAGNNPQLADDLLSMLIQQLPNDLTNIEQAYQQSNYTELSQRLHKLRGGVAYCGLPRLKILLSEMEIQLKQNQTNTFHHLFKQLQAEVSLLLSHYHEQKT